MQLALLLPVFPPDPIAQRTSDYLQHHFHSPPYTMIFSKMLPQRIRVVSARSMATLRPRFARPTRRVKDVVRKSPVGLETVAFSMQLAGQLGTSVPYLQGVMEATAKILERIEVSLLRSAQNDPNDMKRWSLAGRRAQSQGLQGAGGICSGHH